MCQVVSRGVGRAGKTDPGHETQRCLYIYNLMEIQWNIIAVILRYFNIAMVTHQVSGANIYI